jgi:D-3-phosphoglycerate dehydrogenase
MNKLKVLVTTTSFQDTPGKHHDLLAEQNWDWSFLRGPLKEEEIIAAIDQFDAVICGDDEYTQKVLEKGANGKLKILSKYGVGLDKIDLEAAKKFGVKVTNCPGINQNSVAEHVFALLLSFEKNIHTQYNSVQQYSWTRQIGHEVFGKTIGIIGFGAVGKEVARIAQAFKQRVLVFDPFVGENIVKTYTNAEKVEDLTLFNESNYITLHTPLTAETKHLINRDVIQNHLTQKPIIINTARAGLVETEAIIDGIENNRISGYLCDVLDHEPISKNEKLVGLNNVIITPHVGSRTYENVVNQGIAAIKNTIELLIT